VGFELQECLALNVKILKVQLLHIFGLLHTF